ncbi:MAG: NTP transferase domain-containing protein [Desulfurococcales archaeon]|nr:NTP transferase domain-containing protein [Desulfurococcales archaeon]
MREAVILAAGYGKGLEPITHTRHKVLTPIIDKPIIEHQLNMLREVGVTRAIIVVNYLRSQVEAFLRRYAESAGMDYVVVDQGKPMGTAHALSKAIEHVRDESFLLIYGDVFTDVDGIRAVAASAPSIGVARVLNPKDFGVIVMKGRMLKEIIEKPENPPSDLVNAGVYALPTEIVRWVDKVEVSERGELELTDALSSYASRNPLKVVELNNWFDVGRPWAVLEVNKWLMSKEVRRAEIKGEVEGNVKIRGPVILEKGATLRAGSYVVGPAYIGHEADVGPNAYIRPYTVIMEGAKIGFNVEVKESIILEHAHVAHQAYVGDSIIGEESNLGAGSILANLRFDGKPVPVTIKGKRVTSGRRKLGAFIGGHVKTGVNVSTYPGVKIGAYSWINPGLTVKKDVPPCTHLVAEEVLRDVKGECMVDLSVWRP